MKAETFPDDCLELVLDVRVMQSFLLGEDQSGFTAERFFFLSRSDGGKGGTAEGMRFDLLQDQFRFVARPYCDVPIGMDWKREMLNNIRMVGE